MDRHLMAFSNIGALLVRMKQGDDSRDKEGSLDVIFAQKIANARHAGTRTILPRAQTARRFMAPTQHLRLVIGIEREGNRRTRAARP